MSFIYILKHPSNPKVCKIGETNIGANTRTAYQGIKWQSYYEFPVEAKHRRSIERFIHKSLSDCNANIGGGAREIFTIPVDEAVEKVHQLIRSYMRIASGARKDTDYWRYVASDDERHIHEAKNNELREQAQRVTVAKNYYADRHSKVEEIKNGMTKLREAGWLDGGVFFLAALFCFPVMIIGAISLNIVGFPVEDIFATADAFVISFAIAIVGAIWWEHKEYVDKLQNMDHELHKLELGNIVGCTNCAQKVRLPPKPTNTEICPKCGCRVNTDIH